MEPGFTLMNKVQWRKTRGVPGLLTPGNEVLVRRDVNVNSMPAWLCRDCKFLLVSFGKVP